MIQGWWEHSRGFGGHLRTIEIVLGSEGVSPVITAAVTAMVSLLEQINTALARVHNY